MIGTTKMEIALPPEIAHYADDLALFVQGMADKLAENAHKGGWENTGLDEALSMLGREVDELVDALSEKDIDGALEECYDIANFALIACSMMVSGRDVPFAPRVKIGRAIDFVEWAGSQTVNHCLLWPFKSKTGPNGEYGSLSKGASPQGRRAHRHACAVANGPPPTQDAEASHLCGQSLCMNGSHLIWETAEENQARKRGHGTAVTPVKLDWSKADEIKRRRLGGESARVLADEFGVSTTSIYKVARGLSYRSDK